MRPGVLPLSRHSKVYSRRTWRNKVHAPQSQVASRIVPWIVMADDARSGIVGALFRFVANSSFLSFCAIFRNQTSGFQPSVCPSIINHLDTLCQETVCMRIESAERTSVEPRKNTRTCRNDFFFSLLGSSCATFVRSISVASHHGTCVVSCANNTPAQVCVEMAR